MDRLTNYLETEVLTAPPQKLQLLLIDAAIRHTQIVRHGWQHDQAERAHQSLVKAQEILVEMLAGVDASSSTTAKQVAAVYRFLHARLVDAGLRRRVETLDEVLGVLKIERDTWSRVCQQLGSSSTAESSSGLASFQA